MSPLSSFLNQTNTGAVLAAMSRSLALIEFDTSGNILTANENFLRTMGYGLGDIAGKHHRMFVDQATAQSADYKLFWERLAQGKFESAEYKRFAKGGREVWLQATYNPVLSAGGKVLKIVKIATDITREKASAVEHAGKIAAISRAQAVIEFTTEGEIVTANENFLSLLGYSLEEVRGRHHRIFVDAADANSPAYTQFWQRLRAGEFIADEFMRVGKGGRQVWIQASYNPILSPDGTVMKVVKFATDVTGRVHAVREIGSGLGKLAKGDLVCEIDQPFIAALDPLRTDFNDSITTLRRALQAVGDNTSSINTGIYEISQASQDLARRTEQQAVSVEEAANSLTQVTGTVQASARRAEEAGALVSRARDVAEKSEGVVREAVAMMSEMEKSSKEIGNILGVIDEIAFQTNLLALNAGVEAARAGEAGRGFAVVAQEVRELAQRSASAAKEIKALIARSGSQVAAGVGLVGETGKALATILVEVREVNRHVTAIVEAAREQTKCLEEISASVSVMDHNTRQNAAMVEESSTASSSLVSEVAELNQQIEQFNLDRPAMKTGNRRRAA